jgi:uncharacterized protein with von Willebrand factor type A (vWA) domain
VQNLEPVEQVSSEDDFAVLLENVVLFARILRRAGMTVGTGQILDLTRALEVIDIGNRVDFYHTARVILVGRREDLPVFDTLFNLFWNSRTAYFLKERAAENRKQSVSLDPVEDCIPDRADLDDALPRTMEITIREEGDEGDDEEENAPETQVLLAYSHDEILRHKDFDAYTSDEMRRARRLMEEIRWKIARRRTRRFESNPLGRFLDLRRTIRRNLRHGGEVFLLSSATSAVRWIATAGRCCSFCIRSSTASTGSKPSSSPRG